MRGLISKSSGEFSRTRQLVSGGAWIWREPFLPLKDAATSCSAALTPGGEQVCAWWARDAWHLAPGASCQMLTAAGDCVLLGPACANAREFRLTSIITKGLVCSTPGASVFGDAGVNWCGWHFSPRTQRCSRENMMNWTWAIKGVGWGAKPVSQGTEAPEKEICPGTPRSEPRPVQCPPDTARTSPTELGVVVPWVNAAGFTHRPLSHRMIEQVLLQNVLNLELRTTAERKL